MKAAGLNFLVMTAAFAALHTLLAACGNTPWGTIPFSQDANPPPGTESGTPPSSEGGGGGNDAGEDANDGSVTIPDGAILPIGTQLATGTSFSVNGVTSDGFVIYEDSDAMTLNAIPVTAQGMPAPTVIGTVGDDTVAIVMGPVVFFWSAVDENTGSGALSIWTHSNGLQKLSTASQEATDGLQAAAVSTDGTKVLFYDNTNAAGNVSTLTLAGTDGPDGSTGKIALAPNVNIGDPGCFPVFAFVGSDVAAVYELAGASDGGTSPADAGTGIQYTGTLNTFAHPGFTAVPHDDQAQCALAVDPTGTTFLYSASSGLYTWTTGSGANQIDPAGVFGQFAASDGGLSVVYTNDSKALAQANVAAPTPTTLATGSFTNVLAISPDGQWALANKTIENLNAGTPPPSWDLYLASATTPGSAATLTSSAVLQPAFPQAIDPFTADSTHALYSYPPPADGGAGVFPSLYAAPTATGVGVGLGFTVGSAFATSGSKIVFNAAGAFGGLDLLAVDTASSTAPTPLVNLVDSVFFLTAGKDKIVYTWSYDDVPAAGLYAAPTPQ
jgi:hypothetical protein